MRLIDADALPAALFQHHVHDGEELEPLLYYFDTIQVVNDAPTVDAVQVVRCKDCKYWFGDDDDRVHSCELDALLRPAGWYCAGGERRCEHETD